jgi:hypothetical protein
VKLPVLVLLQPGTAPPARFLGLITLELTQVILELGFFLQSLIARKLRILAAIVVVGG